MSQNAISFFLDRHLKNGNAARTAILHAQGEITYSQLAFRVNQAGAYLQRLGVRPEQRVALYLHDSPEFIYFFLAALKIGAVAVPLNTFCDAETLAFYLNDTRAPVLVTHHSYTDRIPWASIHAAPFLQHVLYADEPHWQKEAVIVPTFPVSGDDSAFWLYTSGSTGLPKGAVHSHTAMMNCAQNFGQHVLKITENDRCYSASKLFFAYGLGNSLIFPFSVGATSILCQGRADSATVVHFLKQFKPTLFFAVPTLYKQLLDVADVDRGSFEGVRMCISAGESLPERLFDNWLERTGQVLYDGIGSTEAMHIFCANRPNAYRSGTSGKPVEGYEMKIVDDKGAEVAPTEIGRLLVRGKTLAKGYWNRYDLTQRAFQGEWLATGDMYQQTEDGYFRYIGRQDDVFKVSGLWVAPGEIEQAILSHHRVREVVVLAAKDSMGLTTSKAFATLKDDVDGPSGDSVMQEIYEHIKGLLPKYKIPQIVAIVPALPKTATGKIARAELRSRQEEDVHLITNAIRV